MDKLLAAVAIECVAALIVPIAPPDTPMTVPLLVGAFGLMDFGASLSGVIAVSVRQTVTPNHLLGRMTASYRTISYGVIPLGAAMGGWIGQWVGLRLGLLIGVIALFTTIFWAMVSPIVQLRQIDDVQPIADVRSTKASI